jgi:DNA-binding MarR family transcriptional regulator
MRHMKNDTSLFASAFAMGKCKLGDGEVRVLSILRKFGPMQVSDIAKTLRHSSSVTTSLALSLAAKNGRVKMQLGDDDNRVRVYSATEKGARELSESEDEFAKNMKLAIGMLSEKKSSHESM